jgi:heme-degrading monooxygenase HmoA
MFAVIFRAKPAKQDELYSKTVTLMRELAFEKYGCIDFITATEKNGQEIAISYWEDEASIIRWRKDADHQLAQELGRTQWYDSYRVQVVEIKRDYSYRGN